ncbi:histidinol-phosphatase HisJ [bacterium LRH843]|nr:histidinol-phosphatase HisJ [bacterium LRH843]
MIHDGHVHTPFCPHGTKDSFASYCEAAIRLGIKGITFTEHAPLPKTFNEPTPLKDSGMNPDHLESYIKEIQSLKKEYEGALTILLGLEVDYIDGFEKETTNFLNEVGPFLDDSILSVHFLKINEDYLCLDYSPDTFAEAVQLLGSTERVYQHYFQTVIRSIQTDLGRYKPKRIGHITLARKFQKRFPTDADYSREITAILTSMKEKGYELDYNGAGCVKPLCKEPYPNETIIHQAISLDIPLVYGSDSHQASALMSGFNHLVPHAPLGAPICLSRDRID